MAAAGRLVFDNSAGVWQKAGVCPEQPAVGLAVWANRGQLTGLFSMMGRELSIPAAQTLGTWQRRVSEISVSTKHLIKIKVIQGENTLILVAYALCRPVVGLL